MRCRAGLAAALAMTAGAALAESPGFEVDPAWDGWSRPGRTTELAVSVRAPSDGATVVQIASGSQRIRAALELRSGESRQLHVPVSAAARLRGTLEGVGGRSERELRLSLSESPLLAWSVANAAAPAAPGFHSIAVSPDAFPVHAQAYSSIDALVIDAAAMGRLDAPRLQALLAHIARCGRAVFVGLDAEARRIVEHAAGCGGRRAGHVAQPDQAVGVLERELSAPLRIAPTPGELASIGGPDLRAWRRVVLLVLGYLAAAAVVAMSSTQRLAAPALAVAAAVLAVLVTQVRPPAPRLLIWAEAGAGEHIAQYAARLQSAGLKRGATPIASLQSLATSGLCDTQRRADWDWDDAGARFTSVSSGSRLFSPPSLCYSGHFPIARDADARVLADGRLELANTGPSAWPSGVLSWRGKRHALPAVAPGNVLRLDDADGKPPQGALERTAAARTPFDGQALLWPLQLPPSDDLPADASAWLLLRLPPAAGPT